MNREKESAGNTYKKVASMSFAIAVVCIFLMTAFAPVVSAEAVEDDETTISKTLGNGIEISAESEDEADAALIETIFEEESQEIQSQIEKEIYDEYGIEYEEYCCADDVFGEYNALIFSVNEEGTIVAEFTNTVDSGRSGVDADWEYFYIYLDSDCVHAILYEMIFTHFYVGDDDYGDTLRTAIVTLITAGIGTAIGGLPGTVVGAIVGVVISFFGEFISNNLDINDRYENYIGQGMSSTDAEHKVIEDLMADFGCEDGIVIKYIHHILIEVSYTITVGNRWFHWEIPVKYHIWVPLTIGQNFAGIEGQ